MTSFKQFEANRRNALNSTGPVTPEGKERSRCNAVRHGLTAETVIGSLEDAEDYEAFETAVVADYDAETAVQRELVLRLASILWRLRRSTAIESALFEAMAGEREPRCAPNVLGGKVIAISSRGKSRISASSTSPAESALDEFVCAPAALAKAFIRLTARTRLFRSIALAATSTCYGGKHAKLSARYNILDSLNQDGCPVFLKPMLYTREFEIPPSR